MTINQAETLNSTNGLVEGANFLNTHHRDSPAVVILEIEMRATQLSLF